MGKVDVCRHGKRNTRPTALDPCRPPGITKTDLLMAWKELRITPIGSFSKLATAAQQDEEESTCPHGTPSTSYCTACYDDWHASLQGWGNNYGSPASELTPEEEEELLKDFQELMKPLSDDEVTQILEPEEKQCQCLNIKGHSAYCPLYEGEE